MFEIGCESYEHVRITGADVSGEALLVGYDGVVVADVWEAGEVAESCDCGAHVAVYGDEVCGE